MRKNRLSREMKTLSYRILCIYPVNSLAWKYPPRREVIIIVYNRGSLEHDLRFGASSQAYIVLRSTFYARRFHLYFSHRHSS